MKAIYTRIATGGLMRCCLETISNYVAQDLGREIPEGFVLDCDHEAPGNAQIIFLSGAWRWNHRPEEDVDVEDQG